MHRVRVTKKIDVPAERAWEVVDDFGSIARYHPVVESSPIINGVTSGKGASRECHFLGGGTVTEQITDYEPGRSYVVEILDPGKFPLVGGTVEVSVEPAGSAQTDVTFDLRFQPRFGPLGWLMAQTMMKRQFRSILGRAIEGLETHIQTGGVVGPKGTVEALA